MSVAKVIEIGASSPLGIEDAVQQGLAKVSQSVKNILGVRVSGYEVAIDSEWQHSRMACQLAHQLRGRRIARAQ
jgi:flavin-binding protein dodecin